MKDFKLDNHPKINPGFKVPEDYFENFSERIKNKQPENKPSVISIFRKSSTWVPAVAAVFILALLISVLLKQQLSKNDFDATAVENYVVYQSDISQDELIQYLDDKDLDKMKIDLKIQNDSLENIIIDNEEIDFN